jgi:hypothetical protein
MSDHAIVYLFLNPLDQHERIEEMLPAGTNFFHWLHLNYPDGWGRPIKIHRNGEEVPIEESDFVLAEGDVVSIIISPAGEVVLGYLLSALIGAVTSIVVSLVVSLIFGRPKRPSSQVAAPDPVYSLNGGANSARLGEPIPVIYGEVITYPDYVCPPYAYFDGNNQYLDQVLCVGQGEYEIDEILIGDTPVSSLDPSTFYYKVFPPAAHGNVLGAIEADTSIAETMVTSIEVGDQELTGTGSAASNIVFIQSVSIRAPNLILVNWFPWGTIPELFAAGTKIYVGGYTPSSNFNRELTVQSATAIDQFNTQIIVTQNDLVDQDTHYYEDEMLNISYTSAVAGSTAGPFVCCNPDDRGTVVYFDIMFPQGLYGVDKNTGNLTSTSVQLNFVIQPIDAFRGPVGSPITVVETITNNKNSALRLSFAYPVPLGRYSARIDRITPAPTTNEVVNTVVWAGLRFKLQIDNPGPVYGNTTLIATRLRATSGLTGDAANKIRVKCRRKLPIMGQGALTATRDPADAFCDIVTNQNYGARRPLSSIDTAELERLKAKWGVNGQFNGIFNQKATVWEALQIVCQNVAAIPAQTGNKTTMICDMARPFPVQLFSSANMTEDTFTTSYSFDRPGEYSGVRVEYRNRQTFNAAYASWPPSAVDYDVVTMFGCTDETLALQHAKLLWQRRLYRRKAIEFETELEGLIPRMGDRVKVGNELVNWGEAGEVAALLDPQHILLDRDVNWAGMTNPALTLRSAEGAPGTPIPVTMGSSPRVAVLASPVSLSGADGAILWAIGSTESQLQDFTVMEVEHLGGNRTRLRCAKYDPRVWVDALPWQAAG